MLPFGCVDSDSGNSRLLERDGEGRKKKKKMGWLGRVVTTLFFKIDFSDVLCTFHVKATVSHYRTGPSRIPTGGS